MIRNLLLALALLAPVSAEAQQVQPTRGQAQGQRPQQQLQQQRRALEEQIFNRFLNRVNTDMRLDAPGRTRLEQYLRRSGNERRMRVQQTNQLRRRLTQAVKDTTTSDAELSRLISEVEQLKQQEDDHWRRDQAFLGQMLTPRQRAVFLVEWMMFNDRVRDILADRPAAGRSP